jgi:pSer/pThr/pTyr-binding forkhead associated (FHA) protein
MEQGHGKLVLLQQEGPEREFGLSKASITLGRALSNDIVLSDSRASREHARLECGPRGCEIVDLGSSNGTRLNGSPVQRAALKPGDVVGLGSSQLRYEAEPTSDDLGLTRLDSEADVALSMEREILPMAVNETTLPRLVVFEENQATEIPLHAVDSVTIGRTEENDVLVDKGNVSRQHAVVLRRGGGWLLRDLGSTNGTWLRGEPVEERLLQDGDTFRIGRTQIVFKAGHAAEALTMADATFAHMTTRRPVVFVPGLMGSDLWVGNERVWPSVKSFLTNPEQFRYPEGGPFEARAIVDELVIIPNLIKQDQYNRMGDYLVEELGYRRGLDYFEFAYDWRQDVRQSARELARAIDELPTSRPVTIMSHSLGTLVSRYYIERLGGRSRVERAILMGGPHQGTVKALTSLLVAPSLLPFGLLGERLRRVLMTFPSSYQILPTYPVGVDQHGNAINFLEDETWVAEGQVPLLRSAREFRRELGMGSSVPTLSIFGYGLKTLAGLTLKRNNGTLSDITFKSEPNGDSGILVTSAVLPGSDIHPVQQYHGSLFVDNDVRMRLKLELARVGT